LNNGQDIFKITGDFACTTRNSVSIKLKTFTGRVSADKRGGLFEGKIDVLIGNYLIFAYHVKEFGLQGKIFTLPKDVAEKKSVYWAVSKRSIRS
jgi:hypothetical protein